jgi:hypothetical protein
MPFGLVPRRSRMALLQLLVNVGNQITPKT